jgi:hypothetical protein
LATGIVSVSAVNQAERFQTLNFRNDFRVNQRGAIHENCLAVRNTESGVSHRFTPSHLYLPLELKVFTEKMPLRLILSPEALSYSTTIRLWHCGSQPPTLRSARHDVARPPAGSAGDTRRRRPTPEPVSTSPDLRSPWPRRPL